ncbi:MAG TPA: ABC transporter substrate-binding protein [Candidatus Limnocylindrales bacterium]|nr:ABC transporter substrate-binding protein [Candidatus Limnocylindrales bacterium]
MPTHQQPASAKLAAQIGAVAFIVLIAAVACGGASSTASQTQTSRFPLTITEPDGGAVTIAHQPHRIVSLSPTATEMLFAIGAGPQVIAVDDQSNYPASAPKTKLSGFQPNIEAIAGYAPDLVVAAEDLGGLTHGMQALAVPLLLEPAAKGIDDSYAQIQQLGTATGHAAEATSLVARMRSDVGGLVASVAKPARQVRVYHELDNTYYSVTSATFIGQVYKLLGVTNIADAASATVHDYPQLSQEFIVSSNPDLIVLADTKCCQQNLDSVAARPGWGVISAVRSHQVVGVDDDVASRWGPRVIDFMRQVAPHVQQVEKAA